VKFIKKLDNGKAEYLCDCGKTTIAFPFNVKSGNTKSCGCLNKKLASERFTKHGQWRSRTYRSWDNMIQRCTNPNHDHYKYYGGRGIIVCDEWKVFENFLADMGPRPPNKTIDRINCDDGYFFKNCRWTDHATQMKNRR